MFVRSALSLSALLLASSAVAQQSEDPWGPLDDMAGQGYVFDWLKRDKVDNNWVFKVEWLDRGKTITFSPAPCRGKFSLSLGTVAGELIPSCDGELNKNVRFYIKNGEFHERYDDDGDVHDYVIAIEPTGRIVRKIWEFLPKYNLDIREVEAVYRPVSDIEIARAEIVAAKAAKTQVEIHRKNSIPDLSEEQVSAVFGPFAAMVGRTYDVVNVTDDEQYQFKWQWEVPGKILNEIHMLNGKEFWRYSMELRPSGDSVTFMDNIGRADGQVMTFSSASGGQTRYVMDNNGVVELLYANRKKDGSLGAFHHGAHYVPPGAAVPQSRLIAPELSDPENWGPFAQFANTQPGYESVIKVGMDSRSLVIITFDADDKLINYGILRSEGNSRFSMVPLKASFDDIFAGGRVAFEGSRSGDRMVLTNPVYPAAQIILRVGEGLGSAPTLEYRLTSPTLTSSVDFPLDIGDYVEPSLLQRIAALDPKVHQEALEALEPTSKSRYSSYLIERDQMRERAKQNEREGEELTRAYRERLGSQGGIMGAVAKGFADANASNQRLERSFDGLRSVIDDADRNTASQTWTSSSAQSTRSTAQAYSSGGTVVQGTSSEAARLARLTSNNVQDASSDGSSSSSASSGSARTSDQDARKCVSAPVVSPSKLYKDETMATIVNGCSAKIDVRICLKRPEGWNCGVEWGVQPQARWVWTSFKATGEVFWDARMTGTDKPLAQP